MSTELTPAAYKTRLKNLTAKSILVRLADVANEEGYGWPSVERIAAATEVHPRTVKRVLQVFETIGLISRVDRGRGRAFGIQLALDKLGGDLHEDFDAAYVSAQGKKPQRCRRDTLFEAASDVAATPEDVAATRKGVAETFPPDPLIGGTASEPPRNLPPNPPQAGGEEFTVAQREHLASCPPGLRGDFERYYREQNRETAAGEAEQLAEAKLRAGLERLMPNEDEAVAWVMRECGFLDDGRERGLRAVIRGVLRGEREGGRPWFETAYAMADAYRDYRRLAPVLRVIYGPRNFFREGLWRREGWQVDREKLKQREAKVGS